MNKTQLVIYLLITCFIISESSIAQTTEYNVKFDSHYLRQSTYINDPFEALNRRTHKFNLVFYQLVLTPMSKTYQMITPKWGQERLGNFLANLKTPLYIVNNIIQGNSTKSFNNLWRFILNSTFGIAGLFDFASQAGLLEEKEDFSRTLAKRGAHYGIYLVLPIIGPSSARDLSGNIVDLFLDPFYYLINKQSANIKNSLSAIDNYSQNKDFIDTTNKNALDSYSSFRSLYIQNREQDLNLNN